MATAHRKAYMKAYLAKYQAERREELAAYKAKHYRENAEVYKARATKQRQEADKKGLARYFVEYRNRNKKRLAEYHKEYGPEYRAANRHRYLEHGANRRAKKLRASPPWLTEMQREDMRRTYACASSLGLSVDHIVPLQNTRVCGLHVPWNLAMLSLSDNAAKGNRLPKWDQLIDYSAKGYGGRRFRTRRKLILQRAA